MVELERRRVPTSSIPIVMPNEGDSQCRKVLSCSSRILRIPRRMPQSGGQHQAQETCIGTDDETNDIHANECWFMTEVLQLAIRPTYGLIRGRTSV